jgi:branched-chain amino acid transport system substrate-binding protein
MGARRVFTRILVIPGLVAMLASAACSPAGGPQQSQTPKTGADIVIGIPNAATGAYNVEGPLTQQGYDLWADWTNAKGGIEVQGVRHKVRLIYQDDQSNPQMDAQITEQMLTTGGAQFLLGPFGSPPTAGVAPVAEKHQVPVVTPTAGARQVFNGYHYLFGILPPVDQFVPAVDDWELTLTPRPKTLAIITADDAASMLTTQGAVTYAASHGIQVVYNQSYPSGTTNLYPLVQAAKAKNPDLFFNAGHFLEAVAAHKAAKDLMFDAKAFEYSLGPAQPEFVQALGPIADYTITASPWTPQARFKADYGPTSAEFVAAYQKKYNTQTPPGFIPADSMAAGLALEMAIMKANSLDPQKVRDALANLDANIFYGRIKFDATGMNAFHNVLVVQIQNGKVQVVWPQEVATATSTFPTPTWETRFGAPAQPPKAALPKTGVPPSQHR